jgi:hypothetical protein
MEQFKVALHEHLHAHTLYSTDEYLKVLNDSQLKEKILFLHVKISAIIQYALKTNIML